MNKEVIVNRQGISIIVMYIVGSAIVLSPGGTAKQDIWLSIIISVLITVPAIFVYSRILSIYPGKNLFEISDTIFGKMISKIIILFLVWYAFHLGALVIRNFSEFLTTVSIPETPLQIVIAPLGIICIWIVKGGLEVLGRWAGLVFPFLLVIIFGQITLSMTQAEFDNLKPFLYDGIQPVLSSAYSVFTFPFAEIVVALMIFSTVKNKFSTYKVFYLGLFIGGAILLLAATRNILVLGVEDGCIEYFPSYEAVSVINIANFLQRIEVVVSGVFLFAGIIKISVCLLAASKGFAHVLNFNNYRAIVVPVGLLMMNLSCFIYTNTMEMFEWAMDIYKYYAIPFQIIIPLLIWITAEIKIRKFKGNI